jgi:hypothetical protein
MEKKTKKVKVKEEQPVIDEPKVVRVKFLRHLTINGITYWRDKEYDLDIEVLNKIQNKSVIQIIK